MRLCPTCKNTYPDDANFCPQETCATAAGPQRLQAVAAENRARFQLGARLGGGNTGELWKATDSQNGQPVAYKIVSAEVVPNPAALARAEREFKQLLRVQSPKIATIIDCGKTADDRLYVAMELCTGESLEQLLRAGALPFEKAKSIVVQIGQALLEAQKAGIVHRDVAPKNVLVAPSGDVKVINFPLARPINDRAAGVPGYLSPEQIQGKPVDQRSNTYSLAAVFYHLLTGEPPFQGPPETVLELHLGSPPLAPSQRRPEAALTPEVDRVILKGLDKSSSRRHLTLRLFLSEVEALSPPPGAQPATKDAGVGFARTMLFAGGQAEVANLVAKAIAARTGSPPRGVPATTSAGAAAGAAGVAATAAPAPVRPTVAQVAQAVAAAAPRRVPTPAATPAVASAKAPPVASSAPPEPEPPARLTTNAGVAVAAAARHAPGTNGASAVDEFSDRMARLTPPPVTPYPPPRAPIAAAAPTAATIAVAPASAPASAVAAPTPAAPAVPSSAAAAATVAAAAPPNGAEKEAPATSAGATSANATDKAAAKGGAAFRETLWFKKGDVEHMIAEARAKMAAGNKEAAVEVEPDVAADESKPIEDRYVDDGSVTTEDRKKFSLRTGGTATAIPVVRAAAVPGEKMSEREVISEVSGTRRAVTLVLVAVVVAGIVGAVLYMMRDRPALPPPTAPAAHAIPEPPPPGAPPPAQPPGTMAAGRAAAKPRPSEPPQTQIQGREARLEPRAGIKRADEKRSSRRRGERRRR